MLVRAIHSCGMVMHDNLWKQRFIFDKTRKYSLGVLTAKNALRHYPKASQLQKGLNYGSEPIKDTQINIDI